MGLSIYLACTVRGDRGAVSVLRTLAGALEEMGHTILSRHLLDDDVDSAESALGERDVFIRDIEWLEQCDVLVAEASGSSFGVGFEVGYVLGRSDRTSQRVILMYGTTRRNQISRLIVGNAHPRCDVVAYDDPASLMTALTNLLKPKA